MEENLTTSEGKKRDQDDLDKEAQNHDEPITGVGSFMERQFNLTDREAEPVTKKQKIDQNDATKHNATFKASKGGVIGQYLKEQRDLGAREAGPSAAIDLTADDDDIQVVSVKSTVQDPKREICLGSITAKVMAHKVPAANRNLSKYSEKWPPAKMTLQPRVGQEKTYLAIDGKQVEFGKLDLITATAIAPLLKNTNLKMRLAPLLKERPKEPGEEPGHPISKSLDISITLYSTAEAAKGIGRHLSQRQIFLYKPLVIPHGTEVLNPHVPNYDVVPRNNNKTSAVVTAQSTSSYRVRTTEEIKNDVLSMFDKLGKTEELPEAEADTTLVKTELMQHQKQALWFLTKHETHTPPEEDPLWKFTIRKDGSRAWYNVITGDELKKVSPIMGGLLADQMGLGKTLSILSLICSTLDEARAFGNSDMDESDQVNDVARRAAGTLLLCPKSVISNWQEQIGQHLDKSKVSYYMYHGSKREQDLDILSQYDVVVTSYSTAASEFTSTSKNFSALTELEWFRIVLDEAHSIRTQSTTTFKAACALVSKRRWAVTGTPVQNKLDDFGALVKFLKIYPFSDKGIFEKHFMAPFKAGDPQVLDNLRLLVSSITLRRSKDKIDLPDRLEEIVRLDFTSEEQALYDAFAKDANRKVRAMTRGNDRIRGRTYAHVLVNITRLRLICAHGRELLSEDDMKALQGTSYETAIDLGEEGDAENPPMTKDQVYDTFHLLRESTMDVCSCCSNGIGQIDPTDNSSDSSDSEDEVEDIIGYLTPCLHLVCPGCVDKYWTDLRSTQTRDNYATCPQCEQYVKAVMHPISQKDVDDDAEARQQKKGQVKSKKGVEYGGQHTKVKALIVDLKRNIEASRSLVEIGEPPIRSVVFSSWTSYLDLIEIALKDNNIGFLRLDGKMSVSARTAVLDRFKSDASITVCLVSIKAGGQGLNFTAANHVFMMEPQFNPGVELQAVDRVHRLGQKRDVHIRRYIMANSFEEKIVELQKKKIQLANLATGGKAVKQDAKEIFQSLMSLF